jgi:uncharacterized repeat protein (TIGR03803 family)
MRLMIGLSLISIFYSCVSADAGFILTTVASLTDQIGASPYGLAPDGQGGFIGSTQGITFAGRTYVQTGFSFDPVTGNLTRQNNPGVSTWLPDGQGGYYGTSTAGGLSGSGTLFRYDPATNTEHVLADFGALKIVSANNDLSFDGQGHIIGTSRYGGTSGHGTIFSYDLASQKLSILTSFDGTNGAVVNGNLVADGQGHLYGTTYMGGTSNLGTVFRFDVATGTLTSLTSFTDVNGAYPGTGLVSDGKGGFLGTTGFGGSNGDGTVFRVDATTGSVTTISNFAGDNGTRPSTPLIADGKGGFLGATVTGSTTETYNGTIFDLDPTTGALTMVGNFIGGLSQSDPGLTGEIGSGPFSVIIPDGHGNFYGTTGAGGDSNLGTIFKITVPEPASLTLTALGALAMIALLHRSRAVISA